MRQHRGSVHIVMGRVRHHSVRGRHIGEGVRGSVGEGMRGRVGERQRRALADLWVPCTHGNLSQASQKLEWDTATAHNQAPQRSRCSKALLVHRF